VTGRRAVGIDVGGTKALGVALDGDRVVERLRVDTPHDTEGFVEALAAIAEQLGGTTVGVGVPGLVAAGGLLVSAPNVINVRDVALGELLGRRLRHPVAVDNDNTLAALAEWRIGAGRGTTDMVYVGLGTGIGGGLVTGGELQRGHQGFAGELGHVVVDPQGPPCPCGRRGCWERFASGSGLGYLARCAAAAGELDAVLHGAGELDAIRGEHITAATAAGDAQAAAVVRTFAHWVTVGLVNLTNIFDPEIIVVGGGLSDDPDVFLPPIVAAFEDTRFAGAARALPRLSFAELGPDAGAIGAALSAADA
jgi:glucokinase